jgi:phytoene dehydrogenase-like protein
MGGLTAALRLARSGFRVQVLEARGEPGGLASGLTAGGFAYDGGPYVLLDRPGLEWALQQVGLSVAALDLLRIDDVYEVSFADGPAFRMRGSLDATARGLEAEWPGSAEAYRAFVERSTRAYGRLAPLLRVSRPRGPAVLRTGAWRALPFALRTLGAVLRESRLPRPVQEALAVWTHIAAQQVEVAPSALALVPALIHGIGAWYPRGGIAAIPGALARAAEDAGVRITYRTVVRSIVTRDGAARGVETEGGERLEADAVLSGAGGVGTYLKLLPDAPDRERARLAALPLQSPGVCAYLACRGTVAGPYLRFRLGGAHPCRLLIRPSVLDPSLGRDGWWPARLMAPLGHAQAEALGRTGQEAFLDDVLQEAWWRDGVDEVRVVARRVAADWGAEFRLHRDSMNPAMTARLMRAGRLPHRSPHVRGLYLAGSATHPGQWVSFCAISGVLAADCLARDLS